MSKGFARKASAPLRSPSNRCSTSLFEVSRMTGISLMLLLFLMFLSMVIPSISGIITSLITRSYLPVSSIFKPSLPLQARSKRYQSLSSVLMYWAISLSSSTIRILKLRLACTFFLVISCSFLSSSSSISPGCRWLLPSGMLTSKQEPLMPSVRL